jgi:FkbM family methyltransferase
MSPSIISHAAQLLERAAQLIQGKGFGARSITTEVRLACRYIGQRAVVFDVGANRGEFTQKLLESCGERIAELHVFEPSRFHANALGAFEKDKRVKVNYVALGKKSGEAVLHTDEPGSAIASLYHRRLDHFGSELRHREPVRVMTLDQYVQETGVSRIDFLKLDVEGHELAVLEGGRSTVASLVSVVQFEFGGANIDSRTYFQDFWYYFEDLGFRVALISPILGLCPIKAYSEIYECFKTTNYLAVRNAGLAAKRETKTRTS